MFKVSLVVVVMMMQRRVLRNRGKRTLPQSLLQPRLLLVRQMRQHVETQVLPRWHLRVIIWQVWTGWVRSRVVVIGLGRSLLEGFEMPTGRG